jgi:hypothetical protein
VSLVVGATRKSCFVETGLGQQKCHVDKINATNAWLTSYGPQLVEPVMGHCAAVISPTQVLIAGGFSPVSNDFVDTTRIYDFRSPFYVL